MALNITTGKVEMPRLIVLYSADGVGKSSWAASAPKPLFIDLENGSLQLDVDRILNVDTFSKLLNTLGEIAKTPAEYETLVIDPLTRVEAMMMAVVQDPGYNRYAQVLQPYWRQLFTALDKCRAVGLNIVLIAHAGVSSHNEPGQSTPYDKVGLRLEKTAAAGVREYVDAVFFLTRDVVVLKEKTDRKGRAVGSDQRVLHTVAQASFDAKCRYDVPTEIELAPENGWAQVFGAVVDYDAEIKALLAQIKDEAVREKASAVIDSGKYKPDAMLKRLRAQIESETNSN